MMNMFKAYYLPFTGALITTSILLALWYYVYTNQVTFHFDSQTLNYLLLSIIVIIGAFFVYDRLSKKKPKVEEAQNAPIKKKKSIYRVSKLEILKTILIWPYSWFHIKYRKACKLPWMGYMALDKSSMHDLFNEVGIKKTTLLKKEQIFAGRLDLMPLKWSAIDDAIFVDLDDENQAQDDVSVIEKYLSHIRSFRRKKGLDGLVINISVDMLLKQNNYQNEFLSIAQRIDALYETLKKKIPIYLIISNADRISGFSETFLHLSKNEQKQPLGIVLPHQQSKNQIELLNQCFKDLILSLHARISNILEKEKDTIYREQILLFPQQIRSLWFLLRDILHTLFNISLKDRCAIRGLYFASHIQTGETFDRVTDKINHAHRLDAVVHPAKLAGRQSFFIQDLIKKVVVPDHQLLNKIKGIKSYRMTYRQASVFGGASLLLAMLYMSWSYFQHKSFIKHVQDMSIATTNQINHLDKRYASMNDLFQILKTYDDSINVYHNIANLGIDIYGTYQLMGRYEQQYHFMLQQLFAQRILQRMRVLLANQNNPVKLERLVNAYMSMARSFPNQHPDIQSILQEDWDKHFAKNDGDIQQFSHYLQLLMSLEHPGYLIDWDFLEQTRLKLNHQSPIEAIYDLIKEDQSQYPDVNIRQSVHGEANFVFTLTKQISNTIPAFYTKAYLDHMNHNVSKRIASKSHDYWMPGLGLDKNPKYAQNRIEDKVLGQYAFEYKKFWTKYIKGITIKPFTDSYEAANVLTELTNENSQLQNMVDLFVHHVTDLSSPFVIMEGLDRLKSYTGTAEENRLAPIVQRLQELVQWLESVNHEIDPDQAMFDFSSQYALNKIKDHPMIQLRRLTADAPFPIKDWLQQINQQIAQIVLSGAKRHIDKQWRTSVYATWYKDKIEQMYPLNTHSRQDMSVGHFSKYFAQDGKLIKFLQQYILPFVDQSHKDWKIKELDYARLAFDRRALKMFQEIQHISESFFHEGRLVAHKVAFTTDYLDKTSRSLSIRLEPESLLYRHGQPQQIKFTWPHRSDSLEITFGDFDNYQHTLRYRGQWFLFRFYEDFLNEANNRLTIKAGSHEAGLTLNAIQSQQVNAVKMLHRLNLPDHIR